MSATTRPTSSSADSGQPARPDEDQNDWPAMPTETDIYILPDGRVVFADLPAELADLATTLGKTESCAVTPAETP